MQYNLPKRRPYEHPGRQFIQKYGLPLQEDDIDRYADFLREEANTGENPPIRLRAIRWRFGIKLAIEALPDGMSGFTDHEKGIIYVRRDDVETRQQFTEAHEMVEVLYCACLESSQWEHSIFSKKQAQKERLCHKGASAILMPKQAFLRYLDNVSLSLQLASNIAEMCRTSITATIHRMVDLSSESCALVIWHNQATNEGNAEFTGNTLQVQWAESSNMGYISPGHCVSSQSLIWKAYKTGQPQKGAEHLRFGRLNGIFLVEAKKVTLGNHQSVLSLIQPLPNA